MNKYDRKVVAVVGTVLFLVAVAFGLGTISIARLKGLGLLLLIVVGVYLAAQKGLIAKFWKPQSQDVQGSWREQPIGEQEARTRVKDWATESYKRGNIGFRFSDAKTDTARLLWPDGDTEILRYYYTSSGEDGVGVLVFINCNNPDQINHKTVDWEDAEENPFEYSDYFQEYKREKKLQAYSEANRDRRKTTESPLKPKRAADSDD